MYEGNCWGVPSFKITDENYENPFYQWGQDRLWLIEEEIKKRLMEAKKEIFIGRKFDQIIVNDDFEKALHDLKQFIFSGDTLSPERKGITDNSLNLLLD